MTRDDCIARAYDLAEGHDRACGAAGLPAADVDRLFRIADDAWSVLALTHRAGADAPDVLLWRTVAELPDAALASVHDDASARAAVIAALPADIDPEGEGALAGDWVLCTLYLDRSGVAMERVRGLRRAAEIRSIAERREYLSTVPERF